MSTSKWSCIFHSRSMLYILLKVHTPATKSFTQCGRERHGVCRNTLYNSWVWPQGALKRHFFSHLVVNNLLHCADLGTKWRSLCSSSTMATVVKPPHPGPLPTRRHRLRPLPTSTTATSITTSHRVWSKVRRLRETNRQDLLHQVCLCVCVCARVCGVCPSLIFVWNVNCES